MHALNTTIDQFQSTIIPNDSISQNSDDDILSIVEIIEDGSTVASQTEMATRRDEARRDEARRDELGARRVNPIPDSLASFSTLERLARLASSRGEARRV